MIYDSSIEKQFAEDLASLEDPIEAMIGLLKRFLHTNAQFEEIVAPIIERYAQEQELYQKDVQQFANDLIKQGNKATLILTAEE